MIIEPIAHIRSAFPEKFGIPRQSGLAENLSARIVFEPRYRNADALRGLAEFDYIWLIWEFSANRRRGKNEETESPWQPTVRPPRLGGNKSMGVFATRSPFRPNPLGLSSVRIDHIELDSAEGPVIWVKGADLMDGTPIYDIKPYITYADSHPEAASGYVDSLPERKVEVTIPEGLVSRFARNGKFLVELREVLSLDPRPSYQDDPERVYGLSFGGHNVRFKVASGLLTVTDIE
ncbi:MAG: tRNA (N6-threonylcarbamoyladenosine(37)-N6)-methyltransferase TrmO [Bacteroidales bacterium]|nr:tRNA (N6-threonylcarbamoyladenosine(37)-N6)-methyltransferase TrmO [Bacteroidales bacterium]